MYLSCFIIPLQKLFVYVLCSLNLMHSSFINIVQAIKIHDASQDCVRDIVRFPVMIKNAKKEILGMSNKIYQLRLFV